MNRNWYNAPLQGGSRSAHDYGNSGPIQPLARPRSIWAMDYTITAAIVFVVTIVLVGMAGA